MVTASEFPFPRTLMHTFHHLLSHLTMPFRELQSVSIYFGGPRDGESHYGWSNDSRYRIHSIARSSQLYVPDTMPDDAISPIWEWEHQ